MAVGAGERRGAFELVRTFAGHLAVLDHDTREIMHPVGGPVRESMHIYGQPTRLAERLSSPPFDVPLVLLDVGLGGGSTAACALKISAELRGERRRLALHSFDRTTDALALALAAEGAFGFDAEFHAAGQALCERGRTELAHADWTFHLGELPGSLMQLPAELADVVFWDPFSPRRTPEVWNVAAFRALHTRCRPGTFVQTYSGATATRTSLLLSGFYVGLGPAIGDQKRATAATLTPRGLDEPLTPDFLRRVARSSAAFSADAPLDALALLERHPQFHGASIAARDGSA